MKKGLTALSLALVAAGAMSTSANAASTLVYCSEGSPEGFNPAFYTSGTTFDASSKNMFNRSNGIQTRNDGYRTWFG